MSSFGGDNLFGSGSHRMQFGELIADRTDFAFPGQDGSFSVTHGVRRRTITVTGVLRAADAASLNALIAAIEWYVRDGGDYTLVDTWGVSHPHCILRRFSPVGTRDTTASEVLQDYTCQIDEMIP